MGILGGGIAEVNWSIPGLVIVLSLGLDEEYKRRSFYMYCT